MLSVYICMKKIIRRNEAILPEDPDWDTEGLAGPLNIYDLPWRSAECLMPSAK